MATRYRRSDTFKDSIAGFIQFTTTPTARTLHVNEHGFDTTDPMEAVVIDYQQPLKGQLVAIAKHAGARQKAFIACGVIEEPKTRKTRPEWPLYLRILDAELAGIKDGEITRVLYGPDNYGDGHPNATKARTGMATARNLRDGGYRFLPSIPRGSDTANAEWMEWRAQVVLNAFLKLKEE